MFDKPCSTDRRAFWICFGLFALVYLALRVFWLGGDAGIPSVWEYGYNVTDEGYYMGAAKDKYLRGAFNDLACNESFTYGYSAGTHGLAWLGYAVFGLTDWGFRVPFLLLYFAAWSAVFVYVARRVGPVRAFGWCAAFACMPVVVAYERTAGNDLVIAALTALAFCIASGKGVWRIPVAALVTGAVILVKPSVWALLPIVLSSVLAERKTRSAWIDAGIFIVSSVAAVFLFKGLVLLSVQGEAAAAGLSATELIRRTTTYNALPSLKDFGVFLRGFSSFPRDPTMALVSVGTLFISVVPFAAALHDIARRRWGARLLFNLGVPAYVAGISSLNTIYTHYFHPVLILAPVVWLHACEAFEEKESDAGRVSLSKVLAPCAAACGIVCVVVLFVTGIVLPPQELQHYYSKIYNLPARAVWILNGWFVFLFASACAVLVAVFRGIREARRSGWLWFLIACAGGSVALAGLPSVLFARWIHSTSGFYLPHVVLVLAATVLLLVAVFVWPASVLRRRVLAFFPIMAVFAAYLGAPSWRSAAVELLHPPRHVYREAAAAIAEVVPADAVVIGERSRQVLMGHPHRTATTMPGCDPMPIVRRLFADEPNTPVYALLDSQNAYNL